jgi:chloramphenicol 3-O-phosphotransferase
MIKSLILIFIINIQCICNTGSIIIINGTCSSGKSSILQELKKLFDQDAVFLSLDDVYHDVVRQEALELGLIHQQMSQAQEYENITKNIDKIFVTLAPKRLHVIEQFYLQVKQLSLQYRYVILDTMFYIVETQDLDFFVQQTQNIDTFYVLAYCSPDIVAQRLITRNNHKKDTQTRRVIPNLQHFCKLFEPANSPEKIITYLTLQELQKMFSLVQNYFFENQMIETPILQLQESYLKTFFMHSTQIVGIQPRFAHNMVVNTGKHAPQECAQQIKEGFFKSKMIEETA